jgi:hypothetical protein
MRDPTVVTPLSAKGNRETAHEQDSNPLGQQKPVKIKLKKRTSF